jgi:hypothetical protein
MFGSLSLVKGPLFKILLQEVPPGLQFSTKARKKTNSPRPLV